MGICPYIEVILNDYGYVWNLSKGKCTVYIYKITRGICLDVEVILNDYIGLYGSCAKGSLLFGLYLFSIDWCLSVGRHRILFILSLKFSVCISLECPGKKHMSWPTLQISFSKNNRGDNKKCFKFCVFYLNIIWIAIVKSKLNFKPKNRNIEERSFKKEKQQQQLDHRKISWWYHNKTRRWSIEFVAIISQ